jgi:hypothetical protein
LKAELVFKRSISKLRRRIIRHWVEQIMLTTLLLALILNTITIGLQKIGLFEWEGYAVYPLLLLFSFACSLLHALRRKESFQDALIDIDIRLDLKERLSTAHEYHQLGRTSLFMDRLTQEANSLLESLRGRQMVPRYFSRRHLSIPIFAVILILLISIDWSPRAGVEDLASAERFKQIGVQLERYAEHVRPETSEAVKEPQKNFREQMETFARALQGGSMSGKKVLESLDKLMNQSEMEKRRLIDKLKEELSPGDVPQTPVLESLQTGEPTSAEIAELKKELEEMFDGEVPASISKDLSNLALHNEMTAFIEETVETLGVPLKEERLQDGETSLLLGRTKENLSIHEEAFQEKNEPGSGSIARPKKRANDDSEESDDRLRDGEGTVFTAGQEKAKGDKKAPYEIENLETPALRDKGISGRGERYNVLVRSLPAIGRAELREEEIVRVYQKEFENVMGKEDIPPPYREYIKKYFLSIGLGKESEENADTR